MEEKYFGFIYETTNKITGKKYIGKCIFKRLNSWKTYLGSGLYLKRAIKKYGKENFSREILFLALDELELNEIEEFIIQISNAVSSDDYYNLKNTAIGGDIFTYHPRKEEIREMRRKQVSGENNFWYGKEKPDNVIKSIVDANSKKIIVNGISYNSITECSKSLGIKINTIHYRLNSERQSDYFYADENNNPISKDTTRANLRSKKRVEIDGVVYESIQKASNILEISRNIISRRIRQGVYKMLSNEDAERLSKTRIQRK